MQAGITDVAQEAFGHARAETNRGTGVSRGVELRRAPRRARGPGDGVRAELRVGRPGGPGRPTASEVAFVLRQAAIDELSDGIRGQVKRALALPSRDAAVLYGVPLGGHLGGGRREARIPM